MTTKCPRCGKSLRKHLQGGNCNMLHRTLHEQTRDLSRRRRRRR